LEFNNTGGIVLSGTLVMKGQSRDFGIDLEYHESFEDYENPYYFKDDDVENYFYDALLDFYLNHLNFKSEGYNTKDKDENIIHITRTIRLL
jgi:hypothetical protein